MNFNKLVIVFQIGDGEKDIMSSIVYCIHHKEGCKWNDQLRKLKVKPLNTQKRFKTIFV